MPKAVNSMLDHALEYARAGLPVIPLHSILKDGSCTCGSERCPSPGKHPRTKNGLKDASTEERKIEQWWGPNRWPNASIGCVGGGFLCLDIDAKSGGLETLERLIAANAPLPDTAVAETGEYDGERGRHYWYRMPEGINAATRAGVRSGVDVRCTGGYAVMPPSPHASGVTYEWMTDISLDEAADCPEWVYELVPEHVEGESSWSPNPAFRMSKDIKQFLNGELQPELGEQRELLVQAARSVLTTGRSVALTSELLWEGFDGTGGISAADWDDDYPWTPEDIYAIVSDIYAKPPTSPLEKDFAAEDYSFDDFGNAERLVGSFKDPERVRFVPELDKWYLWDEDEERFLSDTGGWMRQRWAEVTELMMKQAASARSEAESKQLYSHALKARAKPRIDAAVSLARDLVATPADQLNADPYLLAVGNGVVDLRDGELYEPEPENLLTKRCPADYDPDAQSDLFDEFMLRVVPDDELRAFLQRAAGYSLTGSIDEHKFFFMYGPPASGKSTFLESLNRLLGTYSTTADPSTFMRGAQARNGSGPSEDLARLIDARLVVTHEIEEGERLAEALISKFTGGDMVAARFLHSRTFEYRPKFKLWIGANHRARVSGSPRSGIWRRLLVIPMEQQIPEGERDPALQRKLREPEAMSAMLAWAVEGARLWVADNEQGIGMKVPDIVKNEVRDYQHESDYLFTFVGDALEITNDPEDRIPKEDLFEYYKGWCDKEGRKTTLSSHKLSRKMVDMDFKYKNAWYDGSTKQCWIGLKLKGVPNVGRKAKAAKAKADKKGAATGAGTKEKARRR